MGAEVGAFPVAAVMCDTAECGALLALEMVEPKRWQLTPIMSGTGRLASEDSAMRSQIQIPLPASWIMVAAASIPCAQSPCTSVLLAAWQGTEIVIAQAHPDNVTKQLELQHLFAISPDLEQSMMFC